MEMSTNTSAHKWLRKVIQEFEGVDNLSKLTRIPKRNFYFWLTREIKEGEDLIRKLEYAIILQNHSKFKSLKLKLMPSSKYLKNN